MVSEHQRRLRCQTGSECTVDHKPHGESDKRSNEEHFEHTMWSQGCIVYHLLLKVLFTSPLGDPSRISMIKSLTEGRL